jgi:hypothetical protein
MFPPTDMESRSVIQYQTYLVSDAQTPVSTSSNTEFTKFTYSELALDFHQNEMLSKL